MKKLTVTVPDAAEMLSLSQSTIRRMCYDGTLRFKQRCVNGRILILMADIEKWLNR